ncbi:MAG: helix-turn-helix transcriptional regulator [Bryobacterales bacterium]|nr:helix-turn-helix transcriptional regulator [Bryobacterales bacterium]
MKFTFDKEWLEKHADRDDNLEIAAGSFSLDQLPPAGIDPGEDPTAVLAFGRLIHLSRRKRGWSVEDLASAARIEVSEAVRIENDPNYVPGPRTVYQLSVALDLPKDRLLQLYGNRIVRDRSLGQQAVKFAARSESVQKLSRQEHQALEEFVKYLNESR